MSGVDSISKSFGDVPKLLGKENYVKWRQRITLALSLTRSSLFVLSIDEATSFAAHSSQWILENMTGDRAWFDSIQTMGSTVRIATAGGASLASFVVSWGAQTPLKRLENFGIPSKHRTHGGDITRRLFR